MRVKRFIKKIGRNLNFNGKETVGFDKIKVECYKCHKRGHFSRECRAPWSQRNRNRDNTRKVVPVETPASTLVVTDEIDKTGLGYDSQLNKRYLSNKSDVFESASDSSVNKSEEDNNQANDKYKAGEGYHAVPPHYTGNFMPPKPDLSFIGLDDSIFKSAISKTVTSVNETKTMITNSSKVPVNAAKKSSPKAATSTSTARYVNTAANKPTAEAVSTACYVQNRVLVTKPHNKTPYELLVGRSQNLDFMKPFRCPVTILITLDHLGIEINANARKARQKKASDHEYILFPFMPSNTQSSNDKDACEVPDKGNEGVSKGNGVDDQEKTNSSTQDVNIVEPSINTTNTNINTEPKKVLQAIADPSWIEAMQEELLQFKLQKVWTLVDIHNGLQVKQKDDGIIISQDKYVTDILKKFKFTTVKTASTPMEPNKALIKDAKAKDVDVHLYRLMIRSLMYLTASRPDIMFVVCDCARDSPFDLEAFSDSDYAGASLDRKSITGGCQFLGKRVCLIWFGDGLSEEFGVTYNEIQVKVSTAEPKLVLLVTVGNNAAEGT
nr:ribonuclease H-like domain, reverse transcriptase, RNA-dependent DNA polymerase [Tanacetum cinerariifolium]